MMFQIFDFVHLFSIELSFALISPGPIFKQQSQELVSLCNFRLVCYRSCSNIMSQAAIRGHVLFEWRRGTEARKAFHQGNHASPVCCTPSEVCST